MNTTPTRSFASLAGFRSLLTSLGLLTTAAFAQETAFQETFDSSEWQDETAFTSTPTNGWIGNGNGDSSLTGIFTEGSNQLLRLWDSAQDGNASATYRRTENIAQGYIEFSVKRLSGSVYFYALDANSTNLADRNFYLAISSSQIQLISVVDGTTSTTERASSSLTDAGYSSTGWNTVRLTFDDVAKSASVSVNGTSIAALTVTNPDTDWFLGSFVMVAGANSATGQGYFDDITIVNSAIPEPAAAATVAGALMLGMAACHRRR